jgi:uncharacterized protein (TIGR02145 family)
MRSRVYITVLFCLNISAIFYGCAEDASSGGKSEPMSFSAEICSRTQTRAAVDTTKHSGTSLIVRAAEPANGITLSVSKMTRTSTADGYWPNGASIAVQQGGTTKQYSVDGSGNITSSSPFYWANKNDVSITSWFPYSASLPTTWLVNSDQSTESNYNSSDFLYLTSTLSYDGSKKLRYNHQTAKVVINVTRPGYASDPSNITSITIGTSNTPIDLSGTIGSDGSISATSTNTGYITPYSLTPDSNYSATYTALVIPQNMQNKEMIAIKVYNTTYYYKPTISTPLQAGHEYDYNITIPIEYYFSDGSWGLLADHATADVHPIGVVFSKKTSAIDKAHGWTHGYAMALTNATSPISTYVWGPSVTEENGVDILNDGKVNYIYQWYNNDSYTTFITDKEGYCETHAISNTRSSTLKSNYPAFYYALNYGTTNENGTTAFTTPIGSSGWFLPSVGQWWDILINLGGLSTNVTKSSEGWCRWDNEDKTGDINDYSSLCANNINNYLNAVDNYVTPDKFNNNNEHYWSSSEYSSNWACGINLFNEGSLYICDDYDKNYCYKVRTVITF